MFLGTVLLPTLLMSRAPETLSSHLRTGLSMGKVLLTLMTGRWEAQPYGENTPIDNRVACGSPRGTLRNSLLDLSARVLLDLFPGGGHALGVSY